MKYILFLFGLSLAFTCSAQDTLDVNDKIRAALNAQAELDSSYANEDESPLTKEDFEVFTGLDFFPVDTNWMVVAQLVRTPDEKPFELATSTTRMAVYRKFGELHFTYGDSALTLSVYQNMRLMARPGFEDYLFLPFGDLTNGSSSYGGGRYMDLRIPDGDTVYLDFNTCYNPYCAYSDRYSCPKVPLNNILNISIKAGVKAFEHH